MADVAPAPANDNDTGSLLSPRRLIMQVLGFVVGLGLLGWIIVRAVEEGGWRRLADAPPAAVVALFACTVISVIFNGSIFWITVRPMQRVGWFDMLRLNVVANTLNYAPVRLGASLIT